MMFDNSPPSSPSHWEQVKAHLPLVLIIGGAVTVFVSMHIAAFAVATMAAAHIVVGLLAVALQWRNRNRSESPE